MDRGQSKIGIPPNVTVFDGKSLDLKERIGGFGEVYHAIHRQYDWDVAVKLLCRNNGMFSEKDLIHETQLMRRAENPYVMKMMGFFRGCKPGCLVELLGIVMELMEFGSLVSLQEKLNRTPPWPLVFRLAHQVALGMSYLHSLNPAIIHGDLKPQNILLDAGLNAKITDFGLAKYSNVSKTVRELPFWTLFHAPPEFFDFVPGGDVCAYDVYSYGVLLWTILNTGQKCMMYDVCGGERPPLEYINGLKAEGLDELVELMKRCWSQKKEDRPSFTECTAVTKTLYDMHRNEIHRAVCQVQTERNDDKEQVVVPIVVSVPPVPAGSTNRQDFLKHACSLSLDPSSVKGEGNLSEDNRKVTATEDQQVFISERLPERGYFEVKWSERYVTISVTNRKEKALSGSGNKNDKSWLLYRAADRYFVKHDGIKTEVFPTEVTSRVKGDNDAEGVYGVYVGHTAGTVSKVKGHTAGTVSFYSVSGDRMKLLHTVQTDATQPLYAGIFVPDYGTAEVCKIW